MDNINKNQVKEFLTENPGTALEKWNWNKKLVKRLLREVLKLESRIKILERRIG